MGNFRLWLPRRIGVALLVFFALAIVLVAPATTARADSNQDAANTAIDIFVAVAQAGGIPIDASVVPILRSVTSCAVSGANIGDCAEKAALSTALGAMGANVDPAVAATITSAVGCLSGGQSTAAQCVAQAGVSGLPPEAQPLANCIVGGGNVANCAETAVLAQALPQLGAQLPPEAQDTVKCVIGGKSLTSCAKDLVAGEVHNALLAAGANPKVVGDVNAMVTCVASGGNAGDCAKLAVTNELPPEVQSLGACLSAPGAIAQTCVANFAAKNIPDPTAAAVVGCMGQPSGDKTQQCIMKLGEKALGNAAQQAGLQALQTALNTVSQLQLDLKDPPYPPTFPQTPPVLANILKVAQGIKDGNWGEIALGVGPEGLEVAARILVASLLSPAAAAALGPAIDGAITNDVNAVMTGFSALKNGDPVGVAEVAFKWYMTQYILPTCDVIPNGGFKDALCNGATKAINWVADHVADIAKGVLGIGKDFLVALGLWDPIDDVATALWDGVTSVVSDIGKFLGLGGDDAPKVVVKCGTSPQAFLASVMGSCLPGATSNALAGRPDTSGVVKDCESYYGQCSAGKADPVTMHNNCQKIGDALGVAVGNATIAAYNAAASYTANATSGFVANIYKEIVKGEDLETDMCSTDFWENRSERQIQCQPPGTGICLRLRGQHCPIFSAEFRTKLQLLQIGLAGRPGAGRDCLSDGRNQACLNAIAHSPNKTVWAGAPDSVYCQKQKQMEAAAAAQFNCTTTEYDGERRGPDIPRQASKMR